MAPDGLYVPLVAGVAGGAFQRPAVLLVPQDADAGPVGAGADDALARRVQLSPERGHLLEDARLLGAGVLDDGAVEVLVAAAAPAPLEVHRRVRPVAYRLP